MICNNIEEVRNNINNIDEQIVKLIALRGIFVKQAAKFKKDSNIKYIYKQKKHPHKTNKVFFLQLKQSTQSYNPFIILFNLLNLKCISGNNS